MSFLIFGFSLLIVLLMLFSKNIFYTYYNGVNFRIKKRMDTMLKLIKVAPVIVLFIIFILTITYFKTKLNIRLSHAWIVLNFWISTTIFYYFIAEIGKIKKLVIALPIAGMIISMYIAIYLTPLYNYENIFKNTNLIIPNLFGLIMLITSYYTKYKILEKEA